MRNNNTSPPKKKNISKIYRMYNIVRLYGFTDEPNTGGNLYDEELYLDYGSFMISHLIVNIKKYLLNFDETKVTFLVNDMVYYPSDTVPAGCLLCIIHNEFKPYKIVFEGFGKVSEIVSTDLNNATDMLNRYIGQFKIGKIYEINWDGTIKKFVCEKIKKSVSSFDLLKQKRPSEALSDHKLDLHLVKKKVDIEHNKLK